MKKLLLFIALLISALGLNAQDATIGDLEFTITSEDPAECAVSGYSGEPVNVIIPSKVTISGKEYTVIFIRSFAFLGCSSLTSIEFGENSQLTSIGDHAFYGCSSLTSIEFGENSQLTSIGDYAFYGCSSLTSIEIPSGVTYIGYNAFSYCDNLTSIEFGENSQLTSIVGNAFSGCSSLTSIEFGENSQLTSIGGYAFSYCDNLTSIEFGENSQLTSIGDNAFYGCSSLTSIEIPSSVTSIGSAAFCYCSSLTSIEIPSGVTSIGDYAFSGCSSLTSIVVESGNTVYDSRDNCNAIIETATNTLIVGCQNTVIPNIVTFIGSTAFYDCSSLTSIEIPSYVTSIGSYAFSGCSSLTSIYCYAETVPATSQDAFSGCPSNMVIYVPAISVNVYKVTSPWKNYTIIALPCVVTASSNPEEAGVITGTGEYELSDTVTLTATANEGYRFVSWTENNNLVSIDKEYSFVVANHRNLVANFEKTYEITATVNPEKVGVVMGKGVYSHGDNVTLVAIPVKTGYEFVNWTEDGEVVSEDVEYSFVATSDRELIANFVLLDYYVSAVANAAEAGKITGSGNYNHGEDVTLTAVANEGYKFVNWTEDGEVVSEDVEYSFVATSDRELVANFVLLDYYVSAVANVAEAGEILGSGNYNHGEDVTLTAVANEGYKFVNWTEDGEVVSSVEEYSFVIIKDRNLVANFEKTYEITATVNPEKVGVVMGKGVYSHGDNVTLVAIPVKTGYEFVNWTEDGEFVSEDVEYSFVATSDRELIANFVLLDYYVSAVANAAEAGEILGSGNYNHGEDVTLTAVANEGYKFVNWTEDGEVISENTQYSFVIIKDRNLVANFEKLEDPEQPGEGVEELTSSFNIYPNPVSDKLYIETEVEIEEVSIFDIYGRRQELSVISCQPSAIDVSGLNSGVYFVKVVTSEGEAMKRIVKK